MISVVTNEHVIYLVSHLNKPYIENYIIKYRVEIIHLAKLYL